MAVPQRPAGGIGIDGRRHLPIPGGRSGGMHLPAQVLRADQVLLDLCGKLVPVRQQVLKGGADSLPAGQLLLITAPALVGGGLGNPAEGLLHFAVHLLFVGAQTPG